MNAVLTPAVRRWIYGVATAALPILVAYGVLDERGVSLWAALLGSLLVPAMAFVHTDPSTPSGMPAGGAHRKPDPFGPETPDDLR